MAPTITLDVATVEWIHFANEPCPGDRPGAPRRRSDMGPTRRRRGRALRRRRRPGGRGALPRAGPADQDPGDAPDLPEPRDRVRDGAPAAGAGVVSQAA